MKKGSNLDIMIPLPVRKFLDATPDAMIILGPNWKILWVNRQAATLFGYFRGELLDRSSGVIIPELYQNISGRILKRELKVLALKKNGKKFPIEMNLNRAQINKHIFIFGTIRDISEHDKLKKELEDLAKFDLVTHLPNRSYFREVLQLLLDYSQKNKTYKIAIFYIDLDDFKKVNDTLNHTIGDIFLEKVGQRLKEVSRKSDFIARLGGDEFAIITEFENLESVIHYAKRLLQAFHKPFSVDQFELYCTLSIGIATYPLAGKTIDKLLANADTSMYRAKKNKDCFEIFSKKVETEVKKRMEIEKALREAIKKNELYLLYQPIISLKSPHLIHSVEVLLRWKNNKFRKVIPAEFIQKTEDKELIMKVDQWVISNAFKQHFYWMKKFPHAIKKITFYINISPSELHHAMLVNMIKALMETYRYKTPSKNFRIEIVETGLMGDLKPVSKVLKDIGKLGIHIGIDDFGTGYSSLMHLRQIPFSFLKIDKQFTQHLTQRSSKTLVSAIINMANILKVDVIAEGVETKAQYEFLKKNQCHYAQGFYFCKPMDENHFAKILKRLT